jgi:hypothetical protein
MNVKVNLNQIFQGAIASLIAWLFKTVNELQQLVAVSNVQIEKLEQVVMDLALREKELNSAITEILIKLGGA